MFKKEKLPKIPVYYINCPGCGNEISASTWNCPYCMETINSMMDLANPFHCSHCRFDNEDNSPFCVNCGTPLTRDAHEFLDILYRLDGASSRKYKKFLKTLSVEELLEFKLYMETWTAIIHKQIDK